MATHLQKSVPIAIYVRGDDQSSTDGQIAELQSHLQHLDLSDECTVYRDLRESSSGLQSLAASLRIGKHRTLICIRADRLNTIFDSLNAAANFLRELEESGVRFISVEDHFDTENLEHPFAELCRVVIGSKKILKSERARFGLEDAKNAGKLIGRPTSPQDENVNRLRRDGTPIRAIADQLRISTSTVQAAIKRHSPEQSPD